VGNLIERGQIEFGLVVDGESSRTVVEPRSARLERGQLRRNRLLRDKPRHPDRGSAAAAMIRATRLAPGGIASRGGTSLARPSTISFAGASLDVGITETRSLLLHRVGAGATNLGKGRKRIWPGGGIRRSVRPAPGKRVAHARAGPRGRFDLAKAFLSSTRKLGNVGPASFPLSVQIGAKLERRVRRVTTSSLGHRQRLNCTVAAVTCR